MSASAPTTTTSSPFPSPPLPPAAATSSSTTVTKYLPAIVFHPHATKAPAVDQSGHQQRQPIYSNAAETADEPLTTTTGILSMMPPSMATTASSPAVAAAAAATGPSPTVYGRLTYKDAVLYITEPLVEIGRNSSTSVCHFPVGKNSFVSRRHLRLLHDRNVPGSGSGAAAAEPTTATGRGAFYLECLSKNGVFVDDSFQRWTAEPLLLPRQCTFRFPSTVIRILFESFVSAVQPQQPMLAAADAQPGPPQQQLHVQQLQQQVQMAFQPMARRGPHAEGVTVEGMEHVVEERQEEEEEEETVAKLNEEVLEGAMHEIVDEQQLDDHQQQQHVMVAAEQASVIQRNMVVVHQQQLQSPTYEEPLQISIPHAGFVHLLYNQCFAYIFLNKCSTFLHILIDLLVRTRSTLQPCTCS